jgi:diguanylate cyclase (GGDEF)-like protein
VRVVVIEDITDRKREAEELARQTAFVDLLRRTATEANAALGAEEAMRTCLQRICEHMGWTVGHALLRAEGTVDATLTGGELWHLADPARFAAFRDATSAMCFTAGIGLPGRALATGKPQWLTDAASDLELLRRDAARSCNLRGGFALPVLVGHDVVAVLEFFSERVEPADDTVLAVFADIGVQLGWVFERERTRAALERHAAEVQALSLADELTGLRNRRGFMMIAAHQLRIASRTTHGALLFFADLNGMKCINDTLGHDMGDVAICATADLLRLSFRDADVIARLGGDEFVVFAPDADPNAIPALRTRLALNVAAYNARGEHPFELSISLGAAIYDPQEPRSLEALLAEADEAMYEQKRARQTQKAASG